MSSGTLIPIDRITRRIRNVRGEKAMLDDDLADLYGVEVRALNQAVQRNCSRFPHDFMFRLTGDEWEALRSQDMSLKKGRGEHRKFLPFAFTEQGVAMLSSVLRSERAAHVNVEIMRAFVRMRALIGQHRDLSRRLETLERKYQHHDRKFAEVFAAIRELMAPEITSGRRIGFRADESE